MVSKSVQINATKDRVWSKIRDFAGVDAWLAGATKVELTSSQRFGVGASRKIFFDDGSVVIEYAVGWQPRKSVSYVATSGLPFEAYHATLSISKECLIQWTSFIISKNSNKSQFEASLADLAAFYVASLGRLKNIIQKAS